MYDLFYHCIHIYIAIQVICFKKIALAVSFGAAQVYKMNMTAQPANDTGQVVVGPYTK